MGNIVMREGATLQRVHGHGTALICTYGGMQRFELGDGEAMVVDTGHLVAFSGGIKTRVGPLSGLITAKLSGEGLVALIEGPGLVYLQSRAEAQLKSWVLPDKKQNRAEPAVGRIGPPARRIAKRGPPGQRTAPPAREDRGRRGFGGQNRGGVSNHEMHGWPTGSRSRPSGAQEPPAGT